MKRIVSLATLILLLLIIGSPLIERAANANLQFIVGELPFIYIRADGSIDPSTVPIQRNGNTYTFTSNISMYSIEIDCDNIVLDGNGFTLKGDYYCNAIKFSSDFEAATDVTTGRHGVTIKNLRLTNFMYGLEIPYATNCILTSNIFESDHCLSMSPRCSNNQITNNTFTGDGTAIWLEGSSNTISSNKFHNYRLGIELYRGTDNVISNNIFTDVGSDIQIDHAENTITSNNVRITSPPPTTIAILSGQNATYNSSSITLVFSIDQNYSWAAYSLDNLANVTITGNITITGLSKGNHSLVVYANSTLGAMGKSQTINFAVAVPFPTTLVVATIFSAILVGTGLLVYFKKFRKSELTNQLDKPSQEP